MDRTLPQTDPNSTETTVYFNHEPAAPPVVVFENESVKVYEGWGEKGNTAYAFADLLNWA